MKIAANRRTPLHAAPVFANGGQFQQALRHDLGSRVGFATHRENKRTLATRPRAFAFPLFVASFGLVTRVLITSLLSRNAGSVYLQHVVQSFGASIN
jgi:hypothetical protein